MTSPLVIGLGITIVLLVLLSGYLFYSMPPVVDPAVTAAATTAAEAAAIERYKFAEKYKGVDKGNYTFYPGWTTGSGTIKMGSLDEAANIAKCDATPACKAFTTSGWGIQNPSTDKLAWKPFYPLVQKKGIYIKK